MKHNRLKDFFNSFNKNKPKHQDIFKTKYQIGEVLFYYHTYPSGKNSVLKITVDSVRLNVKIRQNGTSTQEEFYSPTWQSPVDNTKDIPEDLLGRTIEELTAKLISRGYSLIKNEETICEK